MTEPCRQTRHCADHGWCHRCAPAFADLMSEINVIIQDTCGNDADWGTLYAKVGAALNGREGVDQAAELAQARQTNDRLNLRAQTAEKLAEGFVKAIREWTVSDGSTVVPYDSLKKIGRMAGIEVLTGVRYMQRFDNSQQAEEFIESVYGLLEYWNSVAPPFGPPQSWWWEGRRAELSDVLAGRGAPSAQDILRAQVSSVLKDSGTTQAEMARRLGLSVDYLGQMLAGKAVLTIRWAEQILAVCGQRLEIRAVSSVTEGEQT